MKKFIALFFVFNAICFHTYGQNEKPYALKDFDYRPGYVVTDHHDTLKGEILDLNERESCYMVIIKDTSSFFKKKYRANFKNDRFTFKPDSCLSYHVGNDDYIAYDDTIYFINGFRKYYFLKLIKEDSLSAYVLYHKDGIPQLFIKKKNMRPFLFGGKNFNQMISAYLVDDNALAMKINRGEYSPDREGDLEKVVDAYNAWKHSTNENTADTLAMNKSIKKQTTVNKPVLQENILSHPTNDSIILKVVHRHIYSYSNDSLLSWEDQKIMLGNNPGSRKEFNKAKHLVRSGVIIDWAGAFTIGYVAGYTLGALFTGKKLNGSLAIAGGSGIGALFLGYAMIELSNKHYVKAVNDYNAEIRKHKTADLYLQLSPAGLGIAYKF